MGAGIGACAAVAVQRLDVKADALGATPTVVVAGAVGLVNIAWPLPAGRSR